MPMKSNGQQLTFKDQADHAIKLVALLRNKGALEHHEDGLVSRLERWIECCIEGQWDNGAQILEELDQAVALAQKARDRSSI
jgi:hypothetical protein